ncbi:hypothetical protein [Mucilaginibacter flavus]|uniref:hypothetical protein n=1 Tax=Mucilaginibacter flavus TaxID=931504 RepID=UPI0025B4A487|nr:hypothetical protein [Mucilaginibacter flavus]MDN3579287.1 hypothetical protein [Mucilaginibacter flavus]
MKKATIIIILLAATATFAKAKAPADTTAAGKDYTIADYKGKTFIFDANLRITECDATGIATTNTVIAYQGSRFFVVKVDPKTGDLTIKFLVWTLPKIGATDTGFIRKHYEVQLNNRRTYNFKSEPESLVAPGSRPKSDIKYFILTQRDKATSVSEYTKGQNWSVNFGTFTAPFKFRPTKSVWKDNVSFGTTVSAQYKLSKDWSVGGVLGFSLSSVSLDSASTNGYTKTSTDRPAYSPSLSGLISYKNINFTLGGGIDWINRPTPLERSWIFHGKPWIGLGIGVNLFTNKEAQTATTKPADQSN